MPFEILQRLLRAFLGARVGGKNGITPSNAGKFAICQARHWPFSGQFFLENAGIWWEGMGAKLGMGRLASCKPNRVPHLLNPVYLQEFPKGAFGSYKFD
ncbi:MAG: hypothetical protein IT258_12095 [Saprospiraceae bacterium]|nr:hypothetical protein [Saprospiraceae bacterium]